MSASKSSSLRPEPFVTAPHFVQVNSRVRHSVK